MGRPCQDWRGPPCHQRRLGAARGRWWQRPRASVHEIHCSETSGPSAGPTAALQGRLAGLQELQPKNPPLAHVEWHFPATIPENPRCHELGQWPSARGKMLDMGSLRAGGGLWLMQVTDNSEHVRRRGRWVSHKMMEVYVQEVTSILYLSKLDPERRTFVLGLAALFEELLQKAERWTASCISSKVWNLLLRYGQAS